MNESKRIEPRVGIFITSLHNLSITNSSFHVIFWSWFVHNSENYKPYMTTEITNLKDIQSFYELEDKVKTAHKSYTFKNDKRKIEEVKSQLILSSSEKKTDDWIWNSQKFKATVLHNWDVRNYPFDKHELKIKIEDTNFDYKQLKFMPDFENSKISKDLKLEGWHIYDFKIEENGHIIETTFGNSSLNNCQSTYSQLLTFIIVTIFIFIVAISMFFPSLTVGILGIG